MKQQWILALVIGGGLALAWVLAVMSHWREFRRMRRAARRFKDRV